MGAQVITPCTEAHRLPLLWGVVVDELIVEIVVGLDDVLVSLGTCPGRRCHPLNWWAPNVVVA